VGGHERGSDDERYEGYVVWLVGGPDGGATQVLVARTDDRRIGGAVEHDGATQLLVTVVDGLRIAAEYDHDMAWETVTVPDGEPLGREIARADLTAGALTAR